MAISGWSLYSLLIIIHYLCISAADINNILNFTFNDTIIWLYSSSIIRVTHLPSTYIYHQQPTINSTIVNYNGPSKSIKYNISTNIVNTQNITTITTNDIMINIDHTNQNTVSFIDKSNKISVLSETENTFNEHNDSVLNFITYEINQEWKFSDEYLSIYGWGQYQNGFINFRDSTIRCIQYNTEVCIPFIVTNNKFGILWDNVGLTHLNQKKNIKINNWTSIITSNNGTNKNMTIKLKCDDNINFNTSSGYHFFIDFSENNPIIWASNSLSTTSCFWAIYINKNNEPYDYWTKGINPSSISTKPFQCKQYGEIIEILFVFKNLKIGNKIENYIYYNKPSMKLDIGSYEAPYIDYYFIAESSRSSSGVVGGVIDNIIGSYRILTGGHVPMYSINIYGFWQCKMTYLNQSSILSSASGYRIRNLPIDNIVQDENYWGNLGQGPHFDPEIFWNPKEMFDELHSMNFYVMISVHPDFGLNTIFYNISLQNGYLIPNTGFIDFYNNNASLQYYKFINNSMYSMYNADYIWLDSTEPTRFQQINNTLNNGKLSGNYYLNSYSKFDTKSMYNLFINDYPNKRYFALTRSQFAGQHIYGTTIWSGDINSNWDQFDRQISAGINYIISGNPFWTVDIGGFWRDGQEQYNDTLYQYEMTRWFQFGVFLPIFRVHGHHSNTEYWNYGKYVENSILSIDNLRYRLLPYIYTINFWIYKYHYSLTRALIFDFCCNDKIIYNIYKQFMFGPYLLISIILKNNKTNIYLPNGDNNKYKYWYDFWNGTKYDSNQWLNNFYSPMNIIPIHIHSGSILIMGPFVQYSTQIPWNELEIRIYPGNNANFTLFEDDGFERDSVKNNHYTLIRFIWNDINNTLNIDKRSNGSFDGMIMERIFNIVIVSENHGVGVNYTQNVNKSIIYNGQAMQLHF